MGRLTYFALINTDMVSDFRRSPMCPAIAATEEEVDDLPLDI